MADMRKEQERAELHKMIWNAATDLVHAGGVDAWDFKQYVLGTMFYRYISDNITDYINRGEHEAGDTSFDYAKLSDEAAEVAREGLVQSKGFFILPSELFRMFKYIEKGEVSEETHHYKNAISEIYDLLQVKRKHADNSALMAQINEIVSEYVTVTKNTGEEENKKFDISKIDFDRLRREFEKAKNKNLLLKDLQQLVEERLAKMLRENPLRIDYYQRYQEIVDEYNRDNKKDEIAIIFENLMKLVSELDDEQKRYVKEGFESDEELTMFDLLIKDSLSKEEVKKVMKIMLDGKLLEIFYWNLEDLMIIQCL